MHIIINIFNKYTQKQLKEAEVGKMKRSYQLDEEILTDCESLMKVCAKIVSQ